MKSNIKIIWWMLIVSLCVSIPILCIFTTIKPELQGIESLNIGSEYVYVYEFADPFKDPIIDTIFILNIKNDYVQYKIKNRDYITSTKLSYVQPHCKHLN